MLVRVVKGRVAHAQLHSDGRVFCNRGGAVTPITVGEPVVDASTHAHGMWLLGESGTVYDDAGRRQPFPRRVMSLSCGYPHTLALLCDGRVWAASRGRIGPVSNLPTRVLHVAHTYSMQCH